LAVCEIEGCAAYLGRINRNVEREGSETGRTDERSAATAPNERDAVQVFLCLLSLHQQRK
jgi:hypothetical protein